MNLHNHFSGFLEMILPLVLSLALSRAQKARRLAPSRARGQWIVNLGRPEWLQCLLLLLAAAVLLLAIVFSFSRMGMISMLASLLLLALLIWLDRRFHPQPLGLILLFFFCAAGTAAWLGAAPVVRHFQALSHDDPLERGSEGRLSLWSDSLRLIRERPWTGFGLGCFEFAFTHVQSVELNYTVDHAHNDYLEFAAGLGIPAAAALFLMLFVAEARILSASLLSRSGLARAHALGAFAGVSALLIHGFADFNLQIPANALVFSVLLGLGYAVSLESRAARIRESSHRLPASEGGSADSALDSPSRAILAVQE